jgi:hypothetical protein
VPLRKISPTVRSSGDGFSGRSSGLFSTLTPSFSPLKWMKYAPVDWRSRISTRTEYRVVERRCQRIILVGRGRGIRCGNSSINNVDGDRVEFLKWRCVLL